MPHPLPALALAVGLVLPAAAPARPAPAPPTTATAARPSLALPTHIDGGAWPTSHLQGVAVDRKNGFVYWSYTQMLVKTDLAGAVLGTVEGLTGHLGDLDLNPADGRVYGSLEYKPQSAFYIAVFRGDRIRRVGMDAETDGVMTTVHLAEVARDFTADMDRDGRFDGDTADTRDHRYGTSGIDGVSFGPAFGSARGSSRLTVAYGIYGNAERRDNDHQVLLQYDVRRWERYERPLRQSAPHRSGPRRVGGKFFVRTGNTRFGVQNLEYDRSTRTWLMAVYRGTKPGWANYSLFTVDATAQPRRGLVQGQPERERGLLLPLSPRGLCDRDTGVRGWESGGTYGLESVGNGRFYLASGGPVTVDGERKQQGRLRLHRWTGRGPTPFRPVG